MDNYASRSQWPPHMLGNGAGYALPSPPAEQQYPGFYSSGSSSSSAEKESLSLNLSGLSVASPSNLSPINPSSSSSALSPVTPISPPFGQDRKRSLMEEEEDTPMDLAYEDSSGTQYSDTTQLPVEQEDSKLALINKPLATNNFVTKLYQCVSNVKILSLRFRRMISSPSSSAFISWTELGTSFVVSNVGEFSRSILGSHFKHNNVRSYSN